MRELFDMPPSIAALPRDHRGYPVPKFATWKDGVPDFVLVSQQYFYECINEKLCWLCGGKMGTRNFFVTGPMCTITCTSAEPPVHMGCARFSVRNCPFLTRPLAKRQNVEGKEHVEPGGVMIERNPGMSVVWETDSYRVIRDGNGAPVIKMGPPKDIQWWKEGRPATGDEVIDAIESGVPLLFKMAEAEGPIALSEMEEVWNSYIDTTLRKFLPKKVTSPSNT